MPTDNEFIKNAFILGRGLQAGNTNSPSQFKNRKRQYFDQETTTFVQKYARYASNFFDAKVQGVFEDDPFAWTDVRVRMADIVKPSAAMTKDFDDYKIVLFENPNIEYVRQGTKLVTMGSTWLATNPINVSAADGCGIFRQCNAVWNHFDYYGNLLSEPLVVDSYAARASTPNPQDTLRITRGYFNIICQYNEWTAQLDTNSRIILGRAAYHIRGYADFVQEFTGDYNSIRQLGFIAEYEEPNYDIDDMEKRVAGGKNFSWVVSVSGGTKIQPGQKTTLTASSVRNEKPVKPTDEHPVSYKWKSSNPFVADVDKDGVITATGNGEATITATLEQNAALSASIEVSVSEDLKPRTVFTQAPPAQFRVYQSYDIGAADFIGGAEQTTPIEWTFEGSEGSSYTYVVSEDTKHVRIACWKGSVTPLKITAKGAGDAVVATVELEGL